MQGSLDKAMAAESTGAEVTRFKQWALMIGCLYGSVTLLVAVLATVGVLAGRPLISSGYSSGSSLSFDHLNGDFWPPSSHIDMPLPRLRSITG
ncbi:MAG: hypothetical protein ACLPKB_20600 [Xanthobacteraceae bacterium]